MRAIVRKELADYFSSIRIFILIVLGLGISALAIYQAAQSITTSTDTEFVFLNLFSGQLSGDYAWLLAYPNFLAMFFIPILGIALGFDAVNRERISGTLSRLIAQPVYRDNIINAKFIAGLFIIILFVFFSVLLIAGYGIRMIGVPPSAEEIIRLFLFMFTVIIYGAFWMGLAMLFSTLFRNLASSLLLSIGIWLVFGIFLRFAGYFISNFNIFLTISRFSPSYLFLQAVDVLLSPYALSSRLLALYIDMLGGGDSSAYLMTTPLSLGQSLTVAWPQFITIIALTVICFAVSYILFMRQEIRST
ncbi:MAG: ABC transporter permease subunit [Dehalococcoidales bacterium]|nr:ABC transporter permease subunit [Dehalococcoidales bacterium]